MMIDQTRGTMVMSGAPGGQRPGFPTGNPQLEQEIIHRRIFFYKPLSVLCTVQRESEKNA